MTPARARYLRAVILNTRIALLGGGQLGRMFIENALRYDVHVEVLDPDPSCPCAGIASRFTQGRFDDHDTVMRFAAKADVVGIEIEHVSISALEELQRMGKRVIPDPAVLRIINDKGTQRAFYRERGIASVDFTLIDDPSDIAAHPELLPAFLKTRTGGYDGKGVMPIATLDDARIAFAGPCVLEKRADIEKEIAVIVVRGASGKISTYDPVEMVFDPRFHLVDHLQAPARIGPALISEAKELAERVASAFGAPGLYAVELFLTRSGAMLVNETAPRAHNSGHHTIEGCASSQFDQLLRLYLDLPAGDTTLLGHCAMINLVGEGGTGPLEVQGIEIVSRIPGAHVHLYGKKETRNGRKMGHVMVVARSAGELDRTIPSIREQVRIVPDISGSAAVPTLKTSTN